MLRKSVSRNSPQEIRMEGKRGMGRKERGRRRGRGGEGEVAGGSMTSAGSIFIVNILPGSPHNGPLK